MKKLIALLVAAMLLLGCMPAMAATESDFVGEWYMIWSDDNDGDILVTGDFGDVSVFTVNADGTFSHDIIKWYNGGVMENLNEGTWEINAEGKCIMNTVDGNVYEATMTTMTDPADGSDFTCMVIINGSYNDLYSLDMNHAYLPVRFGGYHESAVEADFEGKWLMSGIEEFDDDGGFYSAFIYGMDGLTVEIKDGTMHMWHETNSEFPEFELPIYYAGADSDNDVFMYCEMGDDYLLFYMDATCDSIDLFGLMEHKVMIFSSEESYPARPAIIAEREAN